MIPLLALTVFGFTCLGGGGDDAPIGSDAGAICTDCLSASKHYVDVTDFGMSPNNDDNGPALQDAIDEAALTGMPVRIPSSRTPYRIVGDVTLKGDGALLQGIGNAAHLQFDGGALIVHEILVKNRGMNIRDLRFSRIGDPGPVIVARNTSEVDTGKHSRITWSNVHILESTGDGLLFEGFFLGTIHGLWVHKCIGTGIVFRNYGGSNANNTGTNAIGIFGGEVQACGWGMEASDTKGITFSGFAVEGNKLGGIWLHKDNRVFTINGGYFENNASTKTSSLSEQGRFCDIRIGDDEIEGQDNGLGNRNIHFNNVFFSDGNDQHNSAVWIGNGHKNIVFTTPLFRAYGSSPIRLLDNSNNTSTGRVLFGDSELGNENALLTGNDEKLAEWLVP